MKPWVIILIAAGVLVLLCCGGTAILSVAGANGRGPLAEWFRTHDIIITVPEDSEGHGPFSEFLRSPFEVELGYPGEVTPREEFVLNIKVSNPSPDENLTVGSIDVYNSLLKGFDIMEVDPPYEVRDSMFGFTTFYFAGKELPPGEKLEFRVHLRAKSIGLYEGELDVCTPGEACTSGAVQIRIVPPDR